MHNTYSSINEQFISSNTDCSVIMYSPYILNEYMEATPTTEDVVFINPYDITQAQMLLKADIRIILPQNLQEITVVLKK